MRKTPLLLALAAIGFTGSAFATNGMNLEGYGPIAAAMGGASMAYDNGTAAVMNNPATLGLMEQGSRLDFAVGMLGPDVTSKMAGMPDAVSGGDAYYMPAVGYTKNNGHLTYGVGMFAQGGMGTEYSATSFMSAGSGLPTRSELGVGRLIFPLAYKVNSDLTIGGSLDYVWAMMDLKMAMSGGQFADMVAPLGGTQTYGTASGTMVTGLAGAVTGGALTGVNWAYFDFSDNNDYTGKTKATGFAGKLGLVYKINPKTSIGMSYHSKTSLGDMKGDATLSMEVVSAGGAGNPFGPAGAVTMPVTGSIKIVDFQWPETYGFGMAHQVNERLMIAADYKRINWADAMRDFKMSFTADSSAANGGFAGATMDATLYQNWDDQDIFLIGMSYKATDALTLRAGANFANNPIPDQYMNPLFPAIEKNHYTAGVGYALNKASDVNFSLQHAPKVSQTNGSGVTVDHSQTSWQFMYSKRF
ncbi:MAG: outer membrane protein transport protein [Pseudomonadota bacterium]|nr:outer membrane protein transport protein [Pseudomonadota bacterium]MDP1572990.1 outer membrane protein transport protein [Pseudomonadota bacterium]MDP1903148.1 outer membrane protein transport protein [Pseudomonadota bacterium]